MANSLYLDKQEMTKTQMSPKSLRQSLNQFNFTRTSKLSKSKHRGKGDTSTRNEAEKQMITSMSIKINLEPRAPFSRSPTQSQVKLEQEKANNQKKMQETPKVKSKLVSPMSQTSKQSHELLVKVKDTNVVVHDNAP